MTRVSRFFEGRSKNYSQDAHLLAYQTKLKVALDVATPARIVENMDCFEEPLSADYM